LAVIPLTQKYKTYAYFEGIAPQSVCKNQRLEESGIRVFYVFFNLVENLITHIVKSQMSRVLKRAMLILQLKTEPLLMTSVLFCRWPS